MEDEALVGLARRAPARREVDIDDPVRRAELLHGLGAPFFPHDVGGRGGRRPSGPGSQGQEDQAGAQSKALPAGGRPRGVPTAVDPDTHRDKDEPEEGRQERGFLQLPGKDPDKVGNRRVKREGHRLLEGLHPRPRPRQDPHGRRKRR